MTVLKGPKDPVLPTLILILPPDIFASIQRFYFDVARETKKYLFHYLVRSFLINKNYWKLHNLFGLICQSLKSKPGKLVRVNPVKTQHLRWKILTECHAASLCFTICCSVLILLLQILWTWSFQKKLYYCYCQFWELKWLRSKDGGN